MAVTAGRNPLPGRGTFFVGVDVAPGRYMCSETAGGWWIRFTGPGGDKTVRSGRLPHGPAEVVVEVGDFAFQTNVGAPWRLQNPAAEHVHDGPEPLRRVVDPELPGGAEALRTRRAPLREAGPALAVLGLLWMSLWAWAWAAAAAPVVLGALLLVHMRDTRQRDRVERARRDHSLGPEDFDEEARRLMLRAQRAIAAVRESEVNRQGMLDSVDNAVTLPRQEWEIARVLARQARLRHEQDPFLSDTVPPEVQAAVSSLREKLEQSVRAVTRRIEALERYADHALAADEALRAHRQLETLAERAHEYDELVADTVRDDLAVSAIERLTAQGDELVRTLRGRLAEAAAAAAALPPDPP
ncbi:hypothetical protein DPM19_26845 [Actinomadura craniellae]|uniref:Uncharacterized protein n=1 Tax=Actinomadura craniellae TaxID=2231787 RepID=A0A365GYT0_9ACTN|nr:hypothetical protein [Actinomadura craniellae]RAY11972.1 hypothetical protein DPM19_26845 [Actinomadura craniellae]